MKRLTVKGLSKMLAVAFSEFRRNEPLRLAGATAFFTTFALPPILIILIQFIDFTFNIKNLRNKFFFHIAEILGRQSAAQVKITFSGFTSLAKNWWITIGGFIFLMFVATTLFKVIKDSLNQLWNTKPAIKQPFKLQLKSRAISLIIILIAGVLFLGSILAEGIESMFYNYNYSSSVLTPIDNFLRNFTSQGISAIIVTVWFAILFKVLPDAKASWKVVICGGFFTAILFTAGKAIIRYALSLGNITNIFGASGSFVLLLLFLFYSSFILYYGACFTKVFAIFVEEPIEAGKYAVKYKMVEMKSAE